MVVENQLPPPAQLNGGVKFEDDVPLTALERQANKRQANAAYYRSYYLSNKEKILQRRKHRYANDPEYREIIQRSKELARLRELSTDVVADNKEKFDPSVSLSKATVLGNPLANRAKNLKIKSPTLGEAVVKFLTIGQLAEAVGISVATCRKWERMNILPPSNYRNEGKHRLYSIDQVSVVVSVYKKHMKKFADKLEKWKLTEDFQKELYQGWAELHMGVNPERFKQTDQSKLNNAL
jgi:hypothetical protein